MSSIDSDYRDRQIGEFFKILTKIATLGHTILQQKAKDEGLLPKP